ncbi:PHD domain protein [Cryptosporidium xiaoi]|uniref:PHD domain protein n=1 Tax=Cryptosporidium xiaoi TaxID=659607 RepID=A0AAV9XVC7_9CRYT
MRFTDAKPVKSSRATSVSSSSLNEINNEGKNKGKNSRIKSMNESYEPSDKFELKEKDLMHSNNKIASSEATEGADERRVTRSMKRSMDTNAIIEGNLLSSNNIKSKAVFDKSCERDVKKAKHAEISDVCVGNNNTKNDNVSFREVSTDNDSNSKSLNLNAYESKVTFDSEIGIEQAPSTELNTNTDEKSILNVGNTEVANKNVIDKKKKSKKVMKKSKRNKKKQSNVNKKSGSSSMFNVVNENNDVNNGYNHEFDIDSITSVTMINEGPIGTPNSVSGSVGSGSVFGSGSGNSSRLAKLSWSKFDSYFRRIPMGTRKDIILKTIPINLIQRKFIVQELTNLEKTLFVDPPWGKITRNNNPYINKIRLSLPPIYLKGCNLDSIVDIVSRSILKSSRTGNSNSKPCIEINKPYFILFELQDYLYLVSLEPKNFDLVEDKNNQVSDNQVLSENLLENKHESSTTGYILSENKDSFSSDIKKEETDFNANSDDEFNVKWDILGIQELSYYQFRYIERYLHDVFYNYDHNHKKVFFTPAKINDKQDLLRIKVIGKMKESMKELDSIINKNLAYECRNNNTQEDSGNTSSCLFDNKIEFECILKDYINKANESDANCDNTITSSLNIGLDANSVALKKERELININNQNQLISGGSYYSFLGESSGGKSLSWGSYRSYDPIYWWIDFVLPTLLEEDLFSIIGGNTIRFDDIRRVYLRNNGLNDSYIEPPNCVYLGNLYWLDPCKPIKVVKQIDNLCDIQSNRNGGDLSSLVDDTNNADIDEIKNGNDKIDISNNQNVVKNKVETILIHPYMMNQFKENSDFNFVEANLERFLPIYNNIVDSISKIRINIQDKIIHENENRTRMSDIPFIWMNIVQRYQIVNSWNRLKYFILSGYRDLYPSYLKQIESSKTVTESVSNSKSSSISDSSADVNNANSNFENNKENGSSKPNNTHLILTNVCSICFNWETDTLKPFVECVRCGMVSHVGCYGVNIPLNELLDFYGWLCDRCEQEKKQLGTQYLVAFNPGSVTCLLCSHPGGAFKRTNVDGEWVHLVCAIWHLPLAVCEDWKNLSNWNLERLRRSWTNKKTLRKNRERLVLSYLGNSYIEKKEDDCESTTSSGGTIKNSYCINSNNSGGYGKIRNENEKKTKNVCLLEKMEDSFTSQKNCEGDSFSNNTLENEKVLKESEESGSLIARNERESEKESEEPYDKCIYCSNDNTLGLVSCCYKNCSKVYHPICGWLNGISVQIDEEPNQSKGEKLVEYIQGWRCTQDEALRMVSIKSYCRDHRDRPIILCEHVVDGVTSESDLNEEINLRNRRYINRDMFPDLFNSKYNQKSCRGSQIGGIIQRSRTRSISRSKSWDSGTRNNTKKNLSEICRRNHIYYNDSLTVDKYDKDICSICLKSDPSDYPPTLFSVNNEMKDENVTVESFKSGLISCRCCGLTVHWSCYGIPDGLMKFEDFFCQTCQIGIRPERVSCVLCPRMGGALVRAQSLSHSSIPGGGGATSSCSKNSNEVYCTENEKSKSDSEAFLKQKSAVGTHKLKDKPLFVHVICGLYTPGIYLLPGGEAYGVSNYIGMSSLVKLQTEAGNTAISGNTGNNVFNFSGHKNKGAFARRFSGVEGTVQQVPFRDIKNEEQFVFEYHFSGSTLGANSNNNGSSSMFNEQEILDVPPFYCCICKSCYGVNIACSYPGCLRTAHPSCLKLFGCCIETLAELSEDTHKYINNSNTEGISGFSAVRKGLDEAYGIGVDVSRTRRIAGLNFRNGDKSVNETNNSGSSVLYVPPNCQPPHLNINGNLVNTNINENYFLQRAYCPEHGKQMAALNPGGKLLLSTLSSLKIADNIMDNLVSCERIKRKLFASQLDLMNRESPVFSPNMINNVDALRTYFDCYLKGVLQDSVKIKCGTIHRFKDGYIKLNNTGKRLVVNEGNFSKNNTQTGLLNNIEHTQIVNRNSNSSIVTSQNLKRTRSSGEAVPVPSLEEAIKEARKQRELHKKELVASGVIIKKRPPPNRTPCIPFTRLDDEKLKECALNCLKVLGNSSNILNNFVEQNSVKSGYNVLTNTTTSDVSVSTDTQGTISIGDNTGILPTTSLNNVNQDGFIRTFCIKQHRHNCFRKKLAEFILNPPVVMDHKRKTLRSLTRHLKIYGVTAEELMASDVPLPPTKSKPLNIQVDVNNKVTDTNVQYDDNVNENIAIQDNNCCVNNSMVTEEAVLEKQ